MTDTSGGGTERKCTCGPKGACDVCGGEMERGPKLLAWWTDKHGQWFQFLQQDDYYAIRYEQDGEWLYMGSWIDESERYSQTDADHEVSR